MMMVEEGRIRLGDPLSRFIPEFKNMRVATPQPANQAQVDSVPASREITIRDLLTAHSRPAHRQRTRRATVGAAPGQSSDEHAFLLHPKACRRPS